MYRDIMVKAGLQQDKPSTRTPELAGFGLVAPGLYAAGFRHAFSLRFAHKPVKSAGSTEPEPLDFALLRPTRTRAERSLADALGFEPAALYQTTQVHGTRVVIAQGSRAELEKEQADGVLAQRGSGAVAAIRVADCVPVLVGDLDTGDALALHAGWRGVQLNIVHAALSERNPRALRVAIGPCIGACCFEADLAIAESILWRNHRSQGAS
jgi:hypothetical protein